MDLTKYPGTAQLDQEELMSLWWYQPYTFSNDLVSGLAPQFFMKGLDTSIYRRSDHPKRFNKLQDISNRNAHMYQDWGQALCDLSKIDVRQASVFEMACNSGYFLYWLKQQGARHCVGIDQADLGRQQEILNGVTGIDDIDFREGRWSSDAHAIQGLSEGEEFDLTICTGFAQHISDPLHLIKEMSKVTKRAMLFQSLVGYFTMGMKIRYVPADHHEKWGDTFPNSFDTRMGRKLFWWSLKECGFKEIIQLPYSKKWLPSSWYRVFSTVVAIK